MRLGYFFSLVSFLLFLGACTRSESKTPFLFAESTQPGVVAKFNGLLVQENELIKGIESDLYEEEMKIYQMKLDKLKELVSMKIMESDKKSKGLTKEQYFEKYVFAKATDKDVDNFIKERNLPKEQITPEIRDRIKTIVQGENNSKSIDNWISKELGSNKIEVYFKKPQRPKFNVEIGSSPLLGAANAPITIIEFSDFQCPHCARAKEILDQVKKKYSKDLAIVFKNYPLPFHTQARIASNASLCAQEQNKDAFWKMYDYMFANQAKLTAPDLKTQAKNIGLDSAKFDACLDSNKWDKAIQADIDQGNALGVKSTPTIFVNGKLVMGAQGIEVFSEIIDEELQNNKK